MTTSSARSSNIRTAKRGRGWGVQGCYKGGGAGYTEVRQGEGVAKGGLFIMGGGYRDVRKGEGWGTGRESE